MIDLFVLVNWWAVLAGAVVYFLLGAIWYSLLFAKKWMAYRNLNEEDIKEPSPMLFVWSFVLELIAVASLALFIQAMGVTGAVHGAIVGFGAGAGLVFTLTGNTGLFADTKLGLHFIDNGYHVVGLTLAGLVIGIF